MNDNTTDPVRALLPCPFCGEADDIEMQQCQAEHYIQCLACEAATACFSSRPEAREMWNRRAALALQAEAQAQGAVAWQYREPSWGENWESITREQFDAYVRGPVTGSVGGWEVRALYTAPQPAIPVQEADEKEREQDAWNDFESEFLTDGNGYAPAATYGACAAAWGAAWPDAKAAYAAAKAEYQRLHPPCRVSQPAIPEGMVMVQRADVRNLLQMLRGCSRDSHGTSLSLRRIEDLLSRATAAQPNREVE